jgi:hypothetical protein
MKALFKIIYLEDRKTYHPIVYLLDIADLNFSDYYYNAGHRTLGYNSLEMATTCAMTEFIPLFREIGYQIKREFAEPIICKDINDIPKVQIR